MLGLKQRHLRILARRFWGTLFTLIIASAVFLQILREAFPLLDDYRDVVEQRLGEQLGVQVEIDSIRSEWQGLRPKVHLDNLRVNNLQGERLFAVRGAAAELSILDSFTQGSLAWRRIEFQNFEATFEQREKGGWKIQGYDGGGSTTQNQFKFDDPLDIFLFGRRVEINDARLKFIYYSKQEAVIDIPKISLENDQFFHRLVASMSLDDEVESLKLVVEGYGDPRNKRQFSASGYFRVKQIPTEKLLAALSSQGWEQIATPDLESLDKLHSDILGHGLDLELWFKGAPSYGITLNGKVAFSSAENSKIREFELPSQFSADIAGAWSEESGWFVNLQNMDLRWSGHDIPLKLLAVYGKDKDFGLRMAELDAKQWSDLALDVGLESIPDARRALEELQLEGKLKNIDVKFVGKENGYFLLRANVEDGASKAFLGTPEFGNVDGYLEASLTGGYFRVDTEQPVHFFPNKIYSEPFVIDAVKGELRWSIDLETKRAYLQSNRFELSIADGHARGYVAMELPFKRLYGEPEMTIVLTADEMPISHHDRYTPNIVPEDARAWLKRAIRGGVASEPSIFFHGSVEKDPLVSPTVQLYGNARELDLAFDSHWPDLKNASGELFLNNEKVDINLHTATFAGNRVEETQILVRRDEETAERSLIINSLLSGSAESAKSLLLQSPAQTVIGEVLRNWDVTGGHRTKAELHVPFSFKEEDIDYKVQSQLENVSIHIKNIDLSLNQLDGKLEYSKKKLLQADALKLKIFGRNFKAKISSDLEQQRLNIAYSGSAKARSLEKWLQRPEFRFADGTFKLAGDIDIPMKRAEEEALLTLRFNSELLGLGIALPQPFGKLKETGSSLAGLIQVFDHYNTYSFLSNDNLSIDIESKREKPLSILMRTGSALDTIETPPLQEGVLQVLGTLDNLNYQEWDAIRKQYTEYLALYPQEGEGLVTQANLHMAQLNFSDLLLNEIDVGVVGDAKRWRFNLKSENLAGSIVVPLSERPLVLKFDYLHLPGRENEQPLEGAGLETASVFKDWDLSQLVDMDVQVKSLTIDKEDFGSWYFQLRPYEGGLEFNELHAALKHMVLGTESEAAKFYWDYKDGIKSHFIGEVSIHNLGESLLAWNQERLLDAEDGRFNIDVEWADYPDKVSLAGLNGDIDMLIHNGNFLRGGEAGENPLLRLIALFNFDTLARRLRLDFNDLAARGFAFDNVEGELNFKNGTVHLLKPIQVESSSSKMQMAGTVDLVAETVDSELVVTLPVASNLAVATAFVAGLPAAVGVYVVSKMFGEQVDKVSSINYSVTGSWEDPKIKVKKIFDDTAAKKKGQQVSEQLPDKDESMEDASD